MIYDFSLDIPPRRFFFLSRSIIEMPNEILITESSIFIVRGLSRSKITHRITPNITLSPTFWWYFNWTLSLFSASTTRLLWCVTSIHSFINHHHIYNFDVVCILRDLCYVVADANKAEAPYNVQSRERESKRIQTSLQLNFDNDWRAHTIYLQIKRL